MQLGQLLQQSIPCRQQVNFHLTSVFPTGPALHPTQSNASVDQSYNTVMLGLQLLGQFCNACVILLRSATHLQQQLVLQSRSTQLLTQLLTSPQKAAQAVAKMRQTPVITFLKQTRRNI